MAGSAFLVTPLPPYNSHRPLRLLLSSLTPAYTSRPFFHAPPRLCCLAEYVEARGGRDASLSLLAEKPWAHSGADVKVPTPPWMRGPLLLPADDVLDLSKPRRKKKKGKHPGGGSLTGKVRGGRSRQAMRKIVQSIAQLGEIGHLDEEEEEEEEDEEEAAMGDVMKFSIEQVLGGKEEEVAGEGALCRKMPWVGAEKPMVFPRMKKPRVVTTAELILPRELLMRLRVEARKLTKWVKAKKAGVTDDVVDEIMATWRRSELAMVKFVEPLCRNMDRAREIVEIKTGGLVVWSKRNTLVVFRGSKDHNTYDFTHTLVPANDAKEEDHSQPGSKIGEVMDHAESITGSLYEREVNRLLDELGPRFIDWWWPTPLPVDADLLPEIVPDFKAPTRLCPPHVRPKLTDVELTHLRKLARPLPTHFALGKNSKLQGLAAAIIKLWEKSLIAKIVVKRGIPRTDDEQMAKELKRLTGGILILRNKFFIILYRGKDFIPPRVANSIFDRERQLKGMQLQEEEAREKAFEAFFYTNATTPSTNSTGTFIEFRDFKANYEHFRNGNWEIKMKIEAEKERLVKELRKQEQKLQLLKWKIDKSEMELAKLNSKWRSSKQAADQEFLTEEERQTFRRIGLRMDEFLLLGRRGVYDGTIASIHMHWKHREVVKVITLQQKFWQITFTAGLLEMESNGILVAIEKLKRGHMIILYRGKNYQVPMKLLPENLLTKKEALERSIVIQRRGSLKYFAYRRQQSVWELKMKLRALERKMEGLNCEESLGKL